MLDKLRQFRGQLVGGRDFPHQRYSPERNTKGHSTVPSFFFSDSWRVPLNPVDVT